MGAGAEAGGCISFLRRAVLCSVDIHLDKFQGEQRQADMPNFPFLGLEPADHASCFFKSFPDTGDLLLSNLVIAPSLSCVSQPGCPCALGSLACAPLASPGNPPRPGCMSPPTPLPGTCSGDVSHCTLLPAETIIGMPLHAARCFPDFTDPCSEICKSPSSAQVPPGVITRWKSGGFHERSLARQSATVHKLQARACLQPSARLYWWLRRNRPGVVP